MTLKNYLIRFPDRSKKHVSREERDSLLLDGLIKQDGLREYRYIGPTITLHTFAALEGFSLISQQILKRKFLPGLFIFEIEELRLRERLETPEGMVLRLQLA